jgi:hypothetical protein
MRSPYTACILGIGLLCVVLPCTSLGQTAPPAGGGGGLAIEHNPGVILDRLLDGPQITETDPLAEDRLPGLLAASVTALFAGLNQIIPVLPWDEIFGGDGNGGTGGSGRVVLTEVANDGMNSFVEIFNPGGIRLDLDGWAVCTDADVRECQRLSGLAMEPGETLVLQLGGSPDPVVFDQFLFLEVAEGQGELALYNFEMLTDIDPLEPSAMRAYITWGPPLLNPTELQDVALDAVLWRRLDSVSEDDGLRDTAIQLVASRQPVGGLSADDYIVVPFDDNTLGSTNVAVPDTSGGILNGGEDTPSDTPGRGSRARFTFLRRSEAE